MESRTHDTPKVFLVDVVDIFSKGCLARGHRRMIAATLEGRHDTTIDVLYKVVRSV